MAWLIMMDMGILILLAIKWKMKESMLVNMAMQNFIIINELDKKECLLLAKEVEEKVSLKTKLQDSLLILYKMNDYMELIFMIKSKLKKYKQ